MTVTIEELRTPFEKNLQSSRISSIGGIQAINLRKGDQVVVSKKVDFKKVLLDFKEWIRQSASRLPQQCIDDGIDVFCLDLFKYFNRYDGMPSEFHHYFNLYNYKKFY